MWAVSEDSPASQLRRRLNKPYYAFRPQQLVRRVLGSESAELPWKLPFEYEPTGFLGASLRRTGIYDLIVTETLWRLIEPGDCVVDGGANIGYMTSVMASRVGQCGYIAAFEPHPETFRNLSRNAERWPVGIVLHNAALSDSPGSLELFTAADGDANQIKASVDRRSDSGQPIEVPAVRMDDVIDRPVKLIKLDIEDAELLALRGAQRTLATTTHVVYEDHAEQPSDVTKLLQDSGFTCMMLEERFLGPGIRSDISGPRHLGWDPPGFIATRSIEDVQKRLRRRGWQCLSRSAGPRP